MNARPAAERPHPFSCRTLRAKPIPSKRVWTADFPAVALAEFVAFIVVDRAGAIQELLDVAAGGGRGVQKQDAAGFAGGVLPSMRDVAREERAGAGPPTVTSSPILKVISPVSTQATSSLSRCRWKRLLAPTGTVPSNSMMLSLVSWPRSFKAAKRPGAVMSRCFPPPAGTTKPFVA